MDKNSSAKLTTKKSQMASDKPKKSASKKKKKSKKSSSKNQSPDSLEVEGVPALDQNGLFMHFPLVFLFRLLEIIGLI